MARERDDWHDDQPGLDDVVAELPDWVFRSPRGELGTDEAGDAVVEFAGEHPHEWQERRAGYLEGLGLPGRYSAASREFWRAMRAEERRRWPVEPLDGGTDETGPPPE